MRIILLDSKLTTFVSSPAAEVPLLGKPLLYRAIEQWVQKGAQRLDIFLENMASTALPRGDRWGVDLRWHARSGDISSDLLELEPDDVVVVGRLQDYPAPDFLTSRPCCLVNLNGSWSGWAFLKAAHLDSWLSRFSVPGVLEVHHPASRWEKPADLLNLQLRVLREGLVDALETSPGVWQAPGSRYHPSARLHPPLFLGRNTQVGRGVELGPAVVVENHSRIGARCRIWDAWVPPRTLVAPKQTLNNLLVSSSRCESAPLLTPLEFLAGVFKRFSASTRKKGSSNV